MKRRIFILMALILATVNNYGQSLNQFAFESDSVNSYTVKFKEINNLILIPLIFNHSDTLYFILDSGAENITLFGGEFDVPPVDTTRLRKVKVAGAGADDAISAFVSPTNTIRSGPIIGRQLNIIYIPHDFIQFSELLGHPVHGILGVSIFHSFTIKLDYFKREVTFIRPEKFKPRRRFSKVPVMINGTRPYVDLFIEVHPRISMTTNLLVDLGESKPLSLFLSTNEAFILPYPNYNANLGKGLNGIVTGKVARVNSVTLSQHMLRNVITAFPDQEAVQFLTENEQRNGSLGAGILKRFVTIFDLPHEAIFIRRASFLRQPYTYDKTGIILVAEGDNFNKFRVSGIIDRTPAEKAGLQKNDILLEVNGHDLSELKLGEVLNLIEEGGRHLHLVVERDEELLDLSLRVNRFL